MSVLQGLRLRQERIAYTEKQFEPNLTQVEVLTKEGVPKSISQTDTVNYKIVIKCREMTLEPCGVTKQTSFG